MTLSALRVGRTLAVLGLVAAVIVGGLLITGSSAHRFIAVGSPVPSLSPYPAPDRAPSTAHVVTLGDSVTAGTNCDCSAFPLLYTKELAHRYHIATFLRNDGQSGETSQDLLDDLRGDTEARADVARADIVVVTIGANDFGPLYDQVSSARCGADETVSCAREDLDDLQDNLDAIVEQIRELRNDAPTAILLTGYWNVFEDGDVAQRSKSARGRATSDALTSATNLVIHRVAEAQHATYVDLYTPFRSDDGSGDPTGLLAADGDHPNAAGHAVIARALLVAGSAPLSLGR